MVDYSTSERIPNKYKAATDIRQLESFWIAANHMYFIIARIKDIQRMKAVLVGTWNTCNTENLNFWSGDIINWTWVLAEYFGQRLTL